MEDHALYSAPPAPSLKLSDGMSPSPSATRHLSPTEMTYKMTDAEVQEFVKLRVTNRGLFNGRRNSSKLAWRTILKEMGLQGKMSDWQAMKKWENLRNKYKELKNPAPGSTVPTFEWRWFKLMDDAMEGRLEGSAKVLTTMSALSSNDEFLPRKPRKRHVAVLKNEEAVASGGGGGSGGVAEILVNTDDFWGMDMSGDMQMMEGDRQEIEQERAQLDNDRMMVDREREVLERERMVLERERAGLQREQATLERDRASLERVRASVERDRAELDRRTAQLETERAKLEREKVDLHRDRDRVASGKDSGSAVETNGEASLREETKDGELDAAQMAKRQRFLDLFEKLIEKF